MDSERMGKTKNYYVVVDALWSHNETRQRFLKAQGCNITISRKPTAEIIAM